MEIIFLGTSEATPTAKKNQAAILLTYKDENILIDCGEGTQRQLKIANLNACKISRIFITHWHGDHILGLPGLFQTLALNNYNKTLKIYGPSGTKKFLDIILKTFIFREKINIEICEIIKDGKFDETGDLIFEAYNMKHSANCLAYSVSEKDKRKINIDYIKKIGLKPSPLVGELQKGKNIKFNGRIIRAGQATKIIKGEKISFIFDTLINKNCFKVAKNSSLLVSEACFLESEHKDKALERYHLTARQSAEIAKKSNVKKLILSHISQRYSKNENKILEEAKKTFKNTELAKDFMKIVL